MKFAIVGDLHLDDRAIGKRKDDYSQTMLYKLEQINDIAVEKDCDFILQTGDIFNRTTISRNYLCRVIRVFRESELDWYAIAGNHDLKWDRIDLLEDTPLGILLETGYVKSAIGAFDWLEAHHFTKDIKIDGNEVLLGHWYYKKSYDKSKETISDKDIAKNELVILGHEHYTFEGEVKDTQVIIPGAVGRIDSRESNMDRKPCIYTWDMEDSSYERIELDVEPKEAVFDMDSVKENKDNKSIREFVDSLNNKVSEGVDSSDVEEVLSEITQDKELISLCLEYLGG